MLGIGIVGLIQVAVVGGSAWRPALLTGALTIPASAAASTVIWLVVWFLLGFFAYALAFAAVAALVSRQEDVGRRDDAGADARDHRLRRSASSLLPANPGQPAGRGAVADPDLRADADADAARDRRRTGVAGRSSRWPVMLVAIPLLVWISARIYRNAVVRSGARVRLSEAARGVALRAGDHGVAATLPTVARPVGRLIASIDGRRRTAWLEEPT